MYTYILCLLYMCIHILDSGLFTRTLGSTLPLCTFALREPTDTWNIWNSFNLFIAKMDRWITHWWLHSKVGNMS